MLKLYGKKYAATESQAVDSLFERDGTVNGFYKLASGGIVLSDLQGRDVAFIRRDGLGPVTVSRDTEGRLRFMHGLDSLSAAWLGLPEKYGDASDGAKAAAQAAFA
jgi:hypothetical protein